VVGARCADAHAALFAPASTLRKRLVLLLAILESRSPFSESIDMPLGGSAAGAIARVGLRGVVALLGLLVGTVVLLPVRVALALRGNEAA
jgi:hypothetical protein